MILRIKEGAGEEKRRLMAPVGTFVVFETTHLTMKAEKILKKEGIPFRLFPKPRTVVSECGLIVRLLEDDLERATQICEDEGLKIKEVLFLR